MMAVIMAHVVGGDPTRPRMQAVSARVALKSARIA